MTDESSTMVMPAKDPLHTDDGRPFEARMAEYILQHWGEELGADSRFVHTPRGLEILALRIRARSRRTQRQHETRRRYRVEEPAASTCGVDA